MGPAVAFAAASALTGCAALPGVTSQTAAVQVQHAIRAGWERDLSASDFITLRRVGSDPKAATYIFIEGDGRAWRDGGRSPPDDPTPSHSLALTLALSTEGQHSVIYIGRSCQFTQHIPNPKASGTCTLEKWTTARFSPNYIADVIRYLKPHLSDASPSILIGHSGGGAVALLVAKELEPACVVTLASPVNTHTWTTSQKLQPLSKSLNPYDYLSAVPPSKRIHYYGGRDRVVPISSSGLSQRSDRVRLIERNTHSKGWQKTWRDIQSNPCS